MDDTPPPLPSRELPYKRPPAPNWWQRNWPWAAPTGCVSLLVFAAVVIGGILLVVFGAMKSSDAYKTAVQRAKTNGQVINALGSPVSEGIFLLGNINVGSGGSGNANLAIPVGGPREKGTLYVAATRSEGIWIYSTLNVHVDGTGEIIDLRQPARDEK